MVICSLEYWRISTADPFPVSFYLIAYYTLNVYVYRQISLIEFIKQNL